MELRQRDERKGELSLKTGGTVRLDQFIARVESAAAEAAQTAAETAVSRYPKIVNNYWYVWDTAVGDFVNTGVSAEGYVGEDGVSPAVTFGEIPGGHTMTVSDKKHPTGQTINIMDGENGQNGADGVSPTITIDDITGGHRLTITDAAHPQGVSIDVLNGAQGQTGPAVVEVSAAEPTDPTTEVWFEHPSNQQAVGLYTAAEVDALLAENKISVWNTLAIQVRFADIEGIVEQLHGVSTHSLVIGEHSSSLTGDLYGNSFNYQGILMIYKASSNNAYYLTFSRDHAAVGNINIPNASVTIKHDIL